MLTAAAGVSAAGRSAVTVAGVHAVARLHGMLAVARLHGADAVAPADGADAVAPAHGAVAAAEAGVLVRAKVTIPPAPDLKPAVVKVRKLVLTDAYTDGAVGVPVRAKATTP